MEEKKKVTVTIYALPNGQFLHPVPDGKYKVSDSLDKAKSAVCCMLPRFGIIKVNPFRQEDFGNCLP